jgi:DNA-binding IclR family transcriptional regulator
MERIRVSDEVRRFILTSIPSVPFLEALLLLRSLPDRGWDSFQVAARLYTGENQALELLQMLLAAGMVTRAEDGSFRYGPATPELGAMIEALASTYAQDLVGVTDLIHSRIDKRAQQFADAFRWKKERS